MVQNSFFIAFSSNYMVSILQNFSSEPSNS